MRAFLIGAYHVLLRDDTKKQKCEKPRFGEPLACESTTSVEVLRNLVRQGSFGKRSDNLIHDLAVLEDQEGRDASDPELHGGLLI
jgi:hypothetical protein